MYVAPAETIDTVNISTNDFDAEQGMAGGAAITVITKSGTNNFKGSAFYFNNNEKLNASPFYFGGDRPTGKPDKLPSTATSSVARWAARQEEQVVLLRVVRGLQADRVGQPVLQRAHRSACAPAISGARSTPTGASRSSTIRSTG